MQLPTRNSSFASRSEPSNESRESIRDGLFPSEAVRVSSLVSSFKDASMMKVVCDFGLQIFASSKMSRFLLGDQLGNIKVLRYSQKDGIHIKAVHHQDSTPVSGVEHLAVNSSTSNDQTTVRATGDLHFYFLRVEIDNQVKLAAAFSNGSLLLSALKDDDTFEVLAKWNEPRLGENKFIGLSLDDRYSSLYLQILLIISLWLQCRFQLHLQWNSAKGVM